MKPKFWQLIVGLMVLVIFIVSVNTAADYYLPTEEWKVYHLKIKVRELEADKVLLSKGIQTSKKELSLMNIEAETMEKELHIYQLTIRELVNDIEKLRE